MTAEPQQRIAGESGIFRRHGISVAHGGDRHTTGGGKLVFHIFASLAEFERSITRERTRVGLEDARSRGRSGRRLSASCGH